MSPKLKLLAYELARGTKVKDAMVMAGYSPKTAAMGMIRHEGKFVRPIDHPGIAEIVGTIQENVRKGAETSLDDVVRKMEETYEVAKAAGNDSGMLAAATSILKALDLGVDRSKDAPLKPIDEMSEEELRRFLGEDQHVDSGGTIH